MKMFRAAVGETWKDIPGYCSRYSVSDRGRVRSLRYSWVGVLSPGVKRNGYLLVLLSPSDGNKRKGMHVHRLVAQAFIPNPEGKPEVNHKDGNPGNNCVENLEWMTHRENMAHAVARRGGVNWATGVSRGGRKVVAIRDDGKRFRFDSLRAGAEWLSGLTVANGGEPMKWQNVSPNICHAARSGRKSYGFVWEYANQGRSAAWVRKHQANPLQSAPDLTPEGTE